MARLDASLRALGSRLIVRRVPSSAHIPTALTELAGEAGARAVYTLAAEDSVGSRVDEAVRSAMKAAGVRCSPCCVAASVCL